MSTAEAIENRMAIGNTDAPDMTTQEVEDQKIRKIRMFAALIEAWRRPMDCPECWGRYKAHIDEQVMDSYDDCGGAGDAVTQSMSGDKLAAGFTLAQKVHALTRQYVEDHYDELKDQLEGK